MKPVSVYHVFEMRFDAQSHGLVTVDWLWKAKEIMEITEITETRTYNDNYTTIKQWCNNHAIIAGVKIGRRKA